MTIGMTEDGSPWRLQLLGSHVLVVGATGAGKGSVVWSTLTAAAPAIRAGFVQAWVIDPKGGMEFGPGQALFTRFAHDAGQGTLAVLRGAVGALTDRAERLRGVTRLHMPTVEEPLILVVIDEIATLSAYVTDRKLRAEVEQLLGVLLTQGRAVGVSVMACVQDPAKDVLALRQLFPTRIALRLTESIQVAMVLGQSARERGALADLIPVSLPGVGYVAEDGTATVTRVRAFHVTDDDIVRVANTFTPHAVGGDVLRKAA
jgi:S-DNA-T family DNA segregation ATPase FtsK/SpoIIIE